MNYTKFSPSKSKMNETIMICVTQNDVEHGLASTSERSIAYYNLSTVKMRYLFEKNNSWFCYSTLLTQQTIRREGSLWKPLLTSALFHCCLPGEKIILGFC